MRFVTILCGAWALASFDSSWAHDVWLWPTEHAVEAGSQVSVGLRIGDHGDIHPTDFKPHLVRRLFVASAGGDREIEIESSIDHVTLQTHEKAGTMSIAYVGNMSTVEMDRERFADYLAEERLGPFDEILDANREGYSRSLKSLVRVGDGALVDCPLGLPLELTVARSEGQHVIVSAMYDGSPVSGLWIERTNHRGATNGAVTDGNGEAAFSLQSGAWVLTATHLQPSDEPGVDWRSWWAATTFGVTADGVATCASAPDRLVDL